VTIEMPETVLIDPESHRGPDSRNRALRATAGKTRIGAGCTIRTGSVLSDAVLEDNVLVKPHTMVIASHLSREPSRAVRSLRDGARLEENARGEIRGSEKSVLGEGVKSMAT